MTVKIPAFEEVADCPGGDYSSRWGFYIERIYGIYIETLVRHQLLFSGLPVRMQFRPETFGKHYAFWHMMQEGPVEDERTPDLERCRRVRWISWTIAAANRREPCVRVFPQQKRGTEQPWALWLHEENYVVILWERNGYFLLKTAFTVKPRKAKELERDWQAYKGL